MLLLLLGSHLLLLLLLCRHLLLLSLHELLPHLLVPLLLLDLLQKQLSRGGFHRLKHFPLLVSKCDHLLTLLLLLRRLWLLLLSLRIGQEQTSAGQVLLLLSRIHQSEVVPLLWRQCADVLLD